MKLGLGLYRHMLDVDHFAFARQIGATHIVAHLVDYFRDPAPHKDAAGQPIGDDHGWGRGGDPDKLWTLDELRNLRRQVNDAGLELEAIENFDPAHWHDVLLDGPKKLAQLEGLKTIVRRVGEAGIPILGYNFSIAGVCGRITGPFARGGAISVGMDEPLDVPLPNGMAWNMVYDVDAPQGIQPAATQAQLWSRLQEFLDALLPVAEASGVLLAAHPDDPPLPTLRGQPRLVTSPDQFQRLLDLHASPANTLEFCVGTLAEMPTGDVYQATRHYARQGKLAYVHFRNVAGKAPTYRETFVDDGDVDMLRIVAILRQERFQGVLIPDHTPHPTCAAPWHAGMAYAAGYLRAALQAGVQEGPHSP